MTGIQAANCQQAGVGGAAVEGAGRVGELRGGQQRWRPVHLPRQQVHPPGRAVTQHNSKADRLKERKEVFTFSRRRQKARGFYARKLKLRRVFSFQVLKASGHKVLSTQLIVSGEAIL